MNPVHIPNEILSCIFEILPKQTLRECFYVCRSWYTLASRLYFPLVTFTENHKPFYTNLLHTRVDGYQTCVFVKRFDFIGTRYGFSEDQLDEGEFTRLLEAASNLDVIRFSRCGTSLKYLKYMKNVPTDCMKKLRLMDIVSGDHAKYDNSDPFFPELDTQLFINNQRLASSIPVVTMSGKNELSIYSALLTVSELHKFTHLEQLYIKKSAVRDLWQPILNGCPNLEVFKFKSAHTNSIDFPESFTVNKKHKKLHTFTLALRYVTQNDVDYIMNYVPKRLKLFTVAMTDTGFEGWTQDYLNSSSGEVFEKLVQHTRQMELVSFKFNYKKIVDRPLTFGRYTMWDAIVAVREEGFEVLLCIDVRRPFGSVDQIEEEIKIDRKTKSIYVKVGFFERDYETWLRHTNFALTNKIEVVFNVNYPSIGRIKQSIEQTMTPEQQQNTTWSSVMYRGPLVTVPHI